MDFIEKTRNEYNVDLIGIGNKAKMKFLTYEDFEAYDWNSQFSEYKISVDTSFKLRRTGLIMR